jgi:multidrug efflux system membrane fusion protein
MMQDQRLAAAPHPESTTTKRPWTRVVLLTVLALLGVGGALAVRSRKQATASATAAAASAATNRVIPVITARVAQRDVPVWLEGLGSVAAFYTVTVKTQVDGRIDKVLFTEGQHVNKGDVLIQIDPRPFAIQLESAQAALARDQAGLKNARLNLDRFKTLSQQQLIAVQQFTDQQSSVDQLDAQIHSDRAQIDSSQLNLDYARIKSPIDGVTGVRLVDPGNLVHVADASGVVVVTQLDPIAVLFTLAEDDLPKVAQYQAQGPLVVEAMSRDGARKLATGKLELVDNQINQNTATIRLKAIFPNPQHTLWPNQFVKARLQLTVRQGALVIPAVAVQRGPQGTFVYVVGAGDNVALRPVVVDTLEGDLALLGKGLAPGEVVVTEGQNQLRPGAKVAVRAPAGPQP